MTTWAQRSSRLAQSRKYEPIRMSSEGARPSGQARTPQDPLTTAGSVRLEGHVFNDRTLRPKGSKERPHPRRPGSTVYSYRCPRKRGITLFLPACGSRSESSRPGRQPGCLHAPSKLYTLLNPIIEPIASMSRKPAAQLQLVDTAHASRGGASVTDGIVDAITTAIVERRLMPGTKLVEQQIADIFEVSRTVVRQALNQLSRDRLVTLEPARGAFVATPSIDEARQVFQVRRLLEAGMMRQLAAQITDRQVDQLRAHLRDERQAVVRSDVSGRTRLLADFHVVLAAPAGQRGAGRADRRPALALAADRADVPVQPFGRAFAATSTSTSSTRSPSATAAPPCA